MFWLLLTVFLLRNEDYAKHLVISLLKKKTVLAKKKRCNKYKEYKKEYFINLSRALELTGLVNESQGKALD